MNCDDLNCMKDFEHPPHPDQITPHAALRVLDRFFATSTRETADTKAAMNRLWTLVIEGR